MRSYVQINHHDTPVIMFRALQTHYPTGQYLQSYDDKRKQWLAWFVLIVDNVEITWYRDWFTKEEAE